MVSAVMTDMAAVMWAMCSQSTAFSFGLGGLL
jgi:hypothetical protein